MKLFQRTLALVCLVLLFIFCVSNGEPITVRFLTWESMELPAFLWLIFSVLAGAVLALLGQSLRGVTRPSDKRGHNNHKSKPLDKDAKTEVETPKKSDSEESVVAGYEGEKRDV
jgi:uncharacterized integral membrane protein